MPHKDPEAHREYMRGWYQRNKEKILARQAERYHYNPEKQREYNWRSRYGLTPEVAREWLSGPCFLCGKPAQCIDHCHKTNTPRGALCRHCNWAIGALGDTPEALEKVLNYVKGAT